MCTQSVFWRDLRETTGLLADKNAYAIRFWTQNADCTQIKKLIYQIKKAANVVANLQIKRYTRSCWKNRETEG